MNKLNILKTIRFAGILFFMISMFIFIFVVSYSSFYVTEDIIRESVTEEHHLAAILPMAEQVTGKTYDSKREIISDLTGIMEKADEGLSNDEKMWSYSQGVYRMNIMKKSVTGFLPGNEFLFLWQTIIAGCIAALMFILPGYWLRRPGIDNDGVYHRSVSNRGWIGITLGFMLVAFYIFIYWYPEYIVNWIILVDPISMAISGNPASQWFLYGVLYTLAILVMGVRMLIRYRHSNYHLVRTGSVMFFQLGFAFLLPEILVALNKPYYDFKDLWPLNYDFFYGWQIDQFLQSGSLGMFMLLSGIGLSLVGVPVLTYFYGKRWYCSWVCGCGGLAETLGDPFRHLSDKTLKAWKAERWIVHGVLVLVVVMTLATLINYFSGYQLLGNLTQQLQQWYGFFIGAAFAGVIGVGFYPWMGSRVWCRFGCPLAAYLGLVQRFKSRFRITTNGGQCISCGNCSTYCEMGIDVRWYAQRGQNIIRSSCVGCGICASVCPRGVLRLENGPEEGRFNEPAAFDLSEDKVKVNF
ncbi:MAG: 4Fe-4S binding protein [Rhodothermaceae bacterium]|nr:4Fe-4S binding protein [Rhodothermaceae bacterium]